MMYYIDSFAHILPKNYYQAVLKCDPTLPTKYPFINIPTLTGLDERIKYWPSGHVKQVISFANINAEDFAEPELAAKLTHEGNNELANIIETHLKYFESGVGMLALNNIGMIINAPVGGLSSGFCVLLSSGLVGSGSTETSGSVGVGLPGSSAFTV